MLETMIQQGDVRRYRTGDKVPWWAILQVPMPRQRGRWGWPRLGCVTFGADVEVELIGNPSNGNVEFRVSAPEIVVRIAGANHILFYCAPGPGQALFAIGTP